MNVRASSVIAGIGMGLAALSVAATATAPQSGAKISYQTQIQPLFDDYCVACHQKGSAQQNLILESGASRSSLVGVRSQVTNRLLVAPGKPQESYLVDKLVGTHLKAGGKGARMPIGGALDARSMALVRGWISQGARAN